MADRKVVFIAFAVEDMRIRNMIRGRSLHALSPFDYVDRSVMDASQEELERNVRTRILRSDGVLAIVSKSALVSSEQMWEIQCARQENREIRGIWAHKGDSTELVGVKMMVWTWDNIANWIDSL